MPRLVVNPGSPAAWEIQLKPGDNFIGRGFSNDFKLTDPSVSGTHCQVTVSQGSTVIKDLGSTNGTFVNRSRIQEAALQSGQTILLGGVEMVFYSDGPAPAPGAAVSADTAPKVRMVGAPVRATAAPVAARAAVTTTTIPAPKPAGGVPKQAVVMPKSAVVLPPPAPAAPSTAAAPVAVAPVRATAAAVLAAAAPAAPPVPLPPPPIPVPPPVAPPLAPVSAAIPHNCKYHPRTAARFRCPQCGQYFCELCVNTRSEGAGTHKYCRVCAVECEAIQVVLPRQPTGRGASFFARAFTAFAYPLKADGVVLLLAGTIFFSIVDAAKFFAFFAGIFGLVALLILFVFGTGYLTCFLRRIITSTAMGESKMPDWPDVTDLTSDVIAPFLQLLGTVIICFFPAIVLGIFVGQGHTWATWLLIAALVLGCLYFPMGFLAVAMLDSVFSSNPLVVMPAILRVPLHYLLTLALFGAVILVRAGGELLVPALVHVRFISAIILNLSGLYLFTVLMRILGLLYLTSKHKLGWLNR